MDKAPEIQPLRDNGVNIVLLSDDELKFGMNVFYTCVRDLENMERNKANWLPGTGAAIATTKDSYKRLIKCFETSFKK